MNGGETDHAGPVNLVDLIDALIEPSEPAPVPLVPETWGWALLAVIAAGLFVWLVRRRVAHRRANAYRQAALAELAQATTPAEIAVVLRRAALAAWPREDVAGLAGADWIAFLDRTGPDGFSETTGRELVTAPWRGGATTASPALRRAAESWLRTHRREPPNESRARRQRDAA
ncbi:DUF4381 domain-containing protein [Palleronia sp. KMU-117]|uniref:DUF4381 domain-containing protein n=1 Tax=Palleronia sp. KMU-117 TaxID=3434108 RepID=UPI003D712EBD